MRLTAPLSFPRMWINMRGKSWYRGKRKIITNDPNFEKIIASGYNVVDANELVKTMSPLYKDYDSLPELASRFPTPPAMDVSHPDWHDKVCKVFDDSSFPIQGLEQALAFTKGVRLSSSLPDALLERANSINFTKEEDEMAKRIVQQAFLWDSYLEKLPKLKNLDLPWFVPRREFGIPWKRSNEILTSNFIRLIESKAPLNVVLSRMIAPQEELRVNMERHGFPVQFRLNAISHLMSTSQIKPVLSKAEIGNTKELPLADMYPIWSTANFADENVYNPADNFTIKPSSKFPFIHTSIFSHHIPGSHTHIHPRWTDDRFMGATILYNFATALLLARRKFGQTIADDLPEPITTQVIHSTGKEFQFSVFQLNTLRLEDRNPTSIKNHVWITEKMNLFSEIKNDYGTEIFEGYNPDILQIVAAMYLS